MILMDKNALHYLIGWSMHLLLIDVKTNFFIINLFKKYYCL
jgi:hypothetical protein